MKPIKGMLIYTFVIFLTSTVYFVYAYLASIRKFS